MLTIVVVMILILVLAGLVVAYVAYPHRGEQLPAAPWLGEVMARAADAAPTIDPEAGAAHESNALLDRDEHDVDDRHRHHAS